MFESSEAQKTSHISTKLSLHRPSLHDEEDGGDLGYADDAHDDGVAEEGGLRLHAREDEAKGGHDEERDAQNDQRDRHALLKNALMFITSL